MNTQILVTFCALFLAQALFIHAKPGPNDLQGAEIRDDPKDIYRALMAAIDEALNNATNTLNAAAGAVNQTVIGFEGKAHSDINSAMAPIDAMLKKSVEEAVTKGSNITKCENYINDLTKLPINLNDDMVACMTTTLSEAESYVNDVLAALQGIEKNMAKFFDKIDECQGNFWTELECLAILNAEMTKFTVEVPVKFATAAANAAIVIQASIPKVGTCYSEPLAQVPIQGQALVGKFSVCIALL